MELLVYTVARAKCVWINVDISLLADLRLLQSAARHRKKNVVKCQPDLPPVHRRNMAGIWKARDLADWIWMSRPATLNLSEYPCSFRVRCCLATPHHWLPSGQKMKNGSLLACSPARNSLQPPLPAQYWSLLLRGASEALLTSNIVTWTWILPTLAAELPY